MKLTALALTALAWTGLFAPANDWTLAYQDKDGAVWLSPSSIHRVGAWTHFLLKVTRAVNGDYFLFKRALNCTTQEIYTDTIEQYSADGRLVLTQDDLASTSRETIGKGYLYRKLCPDVDAMTAAPTPAPAPAPAPSPSVPAMPATDWRIFYSGDDVTLWADRRSVRPQGGFLWFRGKLEAPDIPGYALTDSLVDCRGARTMLLRTTVINGGRTIADKPEANPQWEGAPEALLALVCR